MNFCRHPMIDKMRYRVPYAGYAWIVDVFAGDHAGLVLAEIELTHEHEDFARPPWLVAEVTHDPAYRNSNL
jgi:adenylate cyclase